METLERLDFVLPDFTRTSWTSDRARETWEPRLSRIIRAWTTVEWLTIGAGVRRCCITPAGPSEFVERAAEWARLGLNALPLETRRATQYSYASTGQAVEWGQPFVFTFVLGAPGDVTEFQAAWAAGDQEQIGRMLGYPPCCYQFFRRVWVEQGMVDTTWPMAVATAGASGEERVADVSGPPLSNILWRWMGVRPVSHLPCSFSCEATVALARRYLEVGRDAGFGEEMSWIEEILAWPAEWSALHGIAEVRTPVLKVSTRTDATARKYVVRRRGTAYPEDGTRGLHFPFVVPRKLRVAESSGFRRGLRHPIAPTHHLATWYASDNGFASLALMEEAHAPIVDAAAVLLRDVDAPSVLDLGCGNGALLRRICERVPGAAPYGIDTEPSRLAHARELHAGFAENFATGDMFADDAPWAEDRRYTLAILMPGRLLEVPARAAARLRDRIRSCCEHVLVYAYGDWLDRHGDVRRLAHEAGFELSDGTAGSRAVLARLAPPPARREHA